MPTYLNPLNGISLSAALAEAAVAAPVMRVKLVTYELWHPSMVAPVRVVVNTEPIEATLEADAPRDPGEEVEFLASNVSHEIPEESAAAGTPEMVLRVDNVESFITDALRTARTSTDPDVRDATWQVIERVYVSDDTSGPAVLPVFKASLVRVSMQGPVAVFVARYRDGANTAIPAITFTPEAYPSLLS